MIPFWATMVVKPPSWPRKRVFLEGCSLSKPPWTCRHCVIVPCGIRTTQTLDEIMFSAQSAAFPMLVEELRVSLPQVGDLFNELSSDLSLERQRLLLRQLGALWYRQDGEPEVLAELYDRHGASLFRHALALTRHRADAVI